MNRFVDDNKTLTDVMTKADIDRIVRYFYEQMLGDSIIGFIFTEVAKIDLESHLPVISDFWSTVLFKDNSYKGNALQVHADLHQNIPLTPGHFTRWLYLFSRSVDALYKGPNAELMKQRAELVAKSISAAVTGGNKHEQNLVLPND